uniref:C3H1-type domain-containing protein n=1 Tax=viral metagenome TaxID=1070528 RepID=A0A6C0CAW3_9ZZZZ
MPCKYGIRCSNPMTCKYWHIDLAPAELCPDGKKCRVRSCRKSHDNQYPFCNWPKCNMSTCNFTHPCKYGIKCTSINTCAYDHPLIENMSAIGKSKLLHAASNSAAVNDLRYFDIGVLSFEDLCMNAMDWIYILRMYVNFNNFDWQTTETSFEWAAGEVFQNFANECLGGGTLRLGNVQEEIMMRSLGLLQYLYRGCQNDKMHILSSNLKDNPLLIDTYVVAKDKSMKEHYGNDGLIYAAKNRNLFEPTNPFRVKIMCIAMTHLPKKDGSSYNREMLQVSLESLIKAHMITLIANELDNNIMTNVIHVGNIGCGVFNHNYNVIYVLQKVAVSIAMIMVAPKKNVSVTYHTYDASTMTGIKANAMPVIEYFAANNFDVEGILEKILEFQSIKPEIWGQKL